MAARDVGASEGFAQRHRDTHEAVLDGSSEHALQGRVHDQELQAPAQPVLLGEDDMDGRPHRTVDVEHEQLITVRWRALRRRDRSPIDVVSREQARDRREVARFGIPDRARQSRN